MQIVFTRTTYLSLKMKITFSLIVLLAVVAAGFAADSRLDDIWMEFKTKHQKDYTYSENELFRRAVWEKNYDLIIKHNREADQGMHTYWLGINEYTDMLSNEFVAMMNGFKGRNLTRHLPKFVYDEDTVDRLPKEVDWRNEGYVTDVKNQGDCGSCWAFSTTGSLEGQHFKKTKNLVSLSEQELVDCTSNCGNYGCDGGNVDNAFECIEEMGGIMSEDDYPYVGQRHGRSHRVFSTTGSPKGQHFKKPEKLDSLYKEESGHCTSDYGNTGGNGGYLSSAFWFVMTFGGLMSKRDNPSERQDDDCRFDKTKVAATITGFVDVKSGSEDALQNAVAIVGPISVAIDASDSTFQQYSHGIYKISTCSPTQLDHAVLAVGYGTEDSQDYWLVKNSWGKSWGLDGYIKMARNYGNMCGIATQASYPLV